MTRKQFLSSLGATAALSVLPLKAEDDLTVKLPASAKGSAKPSVDFDVLLWAIAERETGQRDDVTGRKGERSRYQIKPIVWRQHFGVGVPFHKCRGNFAWACADMHLQWLDRQLPAAADPLYRVYDLAGCWRAGLEGWWRAHGNRAAMSGDEYKTYALAVTRLYHDRLRTLST